MPDDDSEGVALLVDDSDPVLLPETDSVGVPLPEADNDAVTDVVLVALSLGVADAVCVALCDSVNVGIATSSVASRTAAVRPKHLRFPRIRGIAGCAGGEREGGGGVLTSRVPSQARASAGGRQIAPRTLWLVRS